jgi:hypothetical protein
MFRSGGGGFGFLRPDEPLELLIILLVFAALIWFAYRILSA